MFQDKSKKMLQNKVLDGGIAKDSSIIILPKNTTDSLADMQKKTGLFAYDSTKNQIVVDRGSGFESAEGGSYQYSVGPDQKYKTIQAAINKAVSDGVNGTQKGSIVIHTKKNGASYVENLTLHRGLTLRSADNFAFGNAVVIEGQHTFASPGGGDPSVNIVCFVQLSLVTNLNGGKALSVTGDDALVILNNCKFQHNGSTGSCVDFNSGGFPILVLFGCSAGSASSDPAIKFNGAIMFMKEVDMTDLAGAAAHINGYYFTIVANNQLYTTGDHVLKVEGGTDNDLQANILSASGANANGLVVDAGAVCNVFHSVIAVPAGTGKVMSGTGTVNGALNAYPGGNSSKAGGLTFNLVPTDS